MSLKQLQVHESAFLNFPRSGAVGALAAEISMACASADDLGVKACVALERAVACSDLLGGAQRQACFDGYARHVLYSDPLSRFTILAIVWGAGQFSPAHAHHTWCAYAVYDGPLHETVYTSDPSGLAKPVCTKVRNPGYSCFAGAGLEQIHRLGNAGTTPAISIHVYGVGRERVATHVNRVLEVVEQKDSLLEQDYEGVGAAPARHAR